MSSQHGQGRKIQCTSDDVGSVCRCQACVGRCEAGRYSGSLQLPPLAGRLERRLSPWRSGSTLSGLSCTAGLFLAARCASTFSAARTEGHPTRRGAERQAMRSDRVASVIRMLPLRGVVDACFLERRPDLLPGDAAAGGTGCPSSFFGEKLVRVAPESCARLGGLGGRGWVGPGGARGRRRWRHGQAPAGVSQRCLLIADDGAPAAAPGTRNPPPPADHGIIHTVADRGLPRGSA